MPSLRRAGLVSAALTTLAITVATGGAEATPGSGAGGVVLSRSTVDGKDYILRKITLAPGGSTGWHHHDGTLYAYVAEGTLTHNKSDCTLDGLYRPGATFVEPSGADHVHIGRNLGAAPVVLYVLYVDPAGSPLSADEPNPGCAFE
jgi:quercetin dioxygenase-like cupin family protein